MWVLGFEPRFSRPQREVLTTRRYPHTSTFLHLLLPLNLSFNSYWVSIVSWIYRNKNVIKSQDCQRFNVRRIIGNNAQKSKINLEIRVIIENRFESFKYVFKNLE